MTTDTLKRDAIQAALEGGVNDWPAMLEYFGFDTPTIAELALSATRAAVCMCVFADFCQQLSSGASGDNALLSALRVEQKLLCKKPDTSDLDPFEFAMVNSKD